MPFKSEKQRQAVFAKLHAGPLLKSEIHPTSKYIRSKSWQAFRISLKGLSTDDKAKQLKRWLKKHNHSRASQVQCTNYINALKRGGQVK